MKGKEIFGVWNPVIRVGVTPEKIHLSNTHTKSKSPRCFTVNNNSAVVTMDMPPLPQL